ncbi:MAG: CDP-alcohol phosphatidyltransferase family protein [FCB group bacterium]|nr:CDP-alcohol phosphatidyltransferase family protein [FCB group bacterium]
MNVHPSIITVAGLIITGLAAWQIWAGHYLIGVIVLFFGSILDAADGEIARRNNVCSKAGAILDSVCDRIGEALIYIALLAGAACDAKPVLIYLVPAAMTGSFMVSYIRARAEGMGIECSVGIFTRVERLFVYITGIVASLFLGDVAIVVMILIMNAGTWITTIHRFHVVYGKGKNQTIDNSV